MLIYSANKEFLGIDEKDLKILGFKSFSELRAEVADFADFFVKTPGYIHNFKHVHWIDFISYADSSEESNVIINANNRNFKSRITIEPFFLTQNPSAQSYMVSLSNLRELTKKEIENISSDIASKPTPSSVSYSEPQVQVDTFDTPKKEIVVPAGVKIDPYEAPLDVDFDFEDSVVEVVPEVVTEQEKSLDDMLDVGDLSVNSIQTQAKVVHPIKEIAPSEVFDNGYVYNPQVASDELGLPLDLIEEFIQDFITQAKEFENNIYAALDASEFEQLKILSHKLKGVAANLRIEDAFDTLSIVNTSNDINTIKENLDTFYRIVAKLSGEEVPSHRAEEVAFQEDVVEEEMFLDFKEEKQDDLLVDEAEDEMYENLLSVKDSQVPHKIEIAELADDEFTSSDIDFSTLDKELQKIEDIEFLELDREIDIDENISLDYEQDLEEEVIPVLHYSKESIAAQIGIDMESFTELFDDYVSESHDILADMRNSVQANDLKSCAHEAMKLQGMSDNMRVKGFDKELEVIISSTDKDEIIDSINRVEHMISHISSTGV